MGSFHTRFSRERFFSLRAFWGRARGRSSPLTTDFHGGAGRFSRILLGEQRSRLRLQFPRGLSGGHPPFSIRRDPWLRGRSMSRALAILDRTKPSRAVGVVSLRHVHRSSKSESRRRNRWFRVHFVPQGMA